MRKIFLKVNGKTVMTSTDYAICGRFIHIHDHKSGVPIADAYVGELGTSLEYLGKHQIDTCIPCLTYRKITTFFSKSNKT